MAPRSLSAQISRSTFSESCTLYVISRRGDPSIKRQLSLLSGPDRIALLFEYKEWMTKEFHNVDEMEREVDGLVEVEKESWTTIIERFEPFRREVCSSDDRERK